MANMSTLPYISDKIEYITVPNDPQIFGPNSHTTHYIIPKGADIQWFMEDDLVRDDRRISRLNILFFIEDVIEYFFTLPIRMFNKIFRRN